MPRQQPTPETEEEWEQYFKDKAVENTGQGSRMHFYHVDTITSSTGDISAMRFIFATSATHGETVMFNMSVDKFVELRDTLNGYGDFE